MNKAAVSNPQGFCGSLCKVISHTARELCNSDPICAHLTGIFFLILILLCDKYLPFISALCSMMVGGHPFLGFIIIIRFLRPYGHVLQSKVSDEHCYDGSGSNIEKGRAWSCATTITVGGGCWITWISQDPLGCTMPHHLSVYVFVCLHDDAPMYPVLPFLSLFFPMPWEQIKERHEFSDLVSVSVSTQNTMDFSSAHCDTKSECIAFRVPWFPQKNKNKCCHQTPTWECEKKKPFLYLVVLNHPKDCAESWYHENNGINVVVIFVKKKCYNGHVTMLINEDNGSTRYHPAK